MLLVSGAGMGCERRDSTVEAGFESSAADDRTLTDADREFLRMAENDNIKERNMGRIALQKSGNPEVREYAQMLVDDHTKALKQLVDLMEAKGMRQPENLPEVKHEALTRLNGLSGAEFDREFVRLMIEDHEKAVAAFRSEQHSARDGAVRDYASRVLPVLEKHLNKARELRAAVSNG
jgi:putative membrane protein